MNADERRQELRESAKNNGKNKQVPRSTGVELGMTVRVVKRQWRVSKAASSRRTPKRGCAARKQ